MIEQTTRSGDENIDTFVDKGVLFFERDTADKKRFGQFGVLGVGVEVFGHLGCQLAGRGQDKAAGHPCAGAATFEHRNHREGKTGCFTGTCLGDAQNVAAFERRRDRAGLNGGGRRIAGLFDGFEDLFIKVQISKSCHVNPHLVRTRSWPADWSARGPVWPWDQQPL